MNKMYKVIGASVAIIIIAFAVVLGLNLRFSNAAVASAGPATTELVQAAPITVGEVEKADLQLDYLSEGSRSQTLRYPDASFIKVHFLKMDLFPGDFVTVSNLAGTEVYAYPNVSGFTTDSEPGFWAISISGDTAVVQLHSKVNPLILRTRGMGLGVAVDKYTRGYSPEVMEAVINSVESTCGSLDRKDAICYQGSYPTEWGLSSAVSGMLLNNGQSWCTGWRVGPDNYMLTNEHCITSQVGVNAAEAWFNFYHTTCGGAIDSVPTKVTGSTFYVDDYTLDFALFSVNNFSAIQGYGYLELDVRTPVLDEEIYLPQHGGWEGRRQFGIEDDLNPGNVCRIDDAITNGRGTNTDTGYYCDTIGGSSGSPVLARSSHKVIAIHHLGYCPTSPNTGARIELIWPYIQPYLEPCPSSVALEGTTAQFELGALRRFRDGMLAGNAAGQIYIDAYYRHASELSAMLLADWGLRTDTARLLREFLPGILSLMGEDGGREMILTRARADRLLNLMDAISLNASPELQADLLVYRSLVKQYTGMTFRSIWNAEIAGK